MDELYDSDGKRLLQEIREEFAEVAKNYGIDIDLSSDCPWDWRAEKVVEV